MQRLRAIRPASAVALFLSLLGGNAAVAERAAPPPRPAAAASASGAPSQPAPPAASASASASANAVAASAPTALVAPAPAPSPSPAPSATPAGNEDVDAPPPPAAKVRAYGTPNEGADIPVKATRRRGFLVGVVGGLDLGSARGTPSEYAKRGDAFRVDTGISPGYNGTLFLGGALTDWFSFSLGVGKHSIKSGDLTFDATTFLFRIEAYPLFSRGGVFRDLGFGVDLGTGTARVDRANERFAAAGGGSSSVFGGSVFYDWLRASTFTAGPYVAYQHLITETLTTDTAIIGARVAFTTGP